MAEEDQGLTLSPQMSRLHASCHVLLYRESQGNMKGLERPCPELPQCLFARQVTGQPRFNVGENTEGHKFSTSVSQYTRILKDCSVLGPSRLKERLWPRVSAQSPLTNEQMSMYHVFYSLPEKVSQPCPLLHPHPPL